MIYSTHPELQATNGLESEPKISHGQVIADYLVLEQSVRLSKRTLTPTAVRNIHCINVEPSSVSTQHLTLPPYGDVHDFP